MRKQAWLVIALILAGFIIALGFVFTGRRTAYDDPDWYGYQIHFEVIQFGNVNGDEFPDMLTWGYRGQAAGNPTLFLGDGKGFHDWSDAIHLVTERGVSQGTETFLADLDGDGDADIITYPAVWENNGKGEFTDRGYYAFCEPVNWRFQRYYLLPAALSGRGSMDILRHDPNYGDFIIGLQRGQFDWEVHSFDKIPGFSVRARHDSRDELVFWNTIPKQLTELFESEGIDYTVDSRLPWEIEKGAGRRTLLLDMNEDGSDEAVRWERKIVSNEAKEVVEIFDLSDEQSERIATIETSSFPISSYGLLTVLPRPKRKFVDFNRDGLRDFLGNDGRIYLQQEGIQFRATDEPVVSREDPEQASNYYAVDVNNDGELDIVSSYRPFTNIVYYNEYRRLLE